VTPTRILFVTPNFGNNSLGRTYCLWLLAKELGWSTRVVGVNGTSIWGPMQGTPFASDCELLADLTPDEQKRALGELAEWSDVIVAVKPLPTSLGLAAKIVAAVPRPLLVDIDDPDIEYRTSWQPLRRRLRARLNGRYQELVGLGELARTLPRMVSNPVLQEWYGGLVIPHVRTEGPRPSPESYDSAGPVTVRFVGSPRGHKGVDVLRRSVAALRDLNVGLEITADPPPDAKPWEKWLGQTSFEVGQALVASADVIALPSLAKSWAVAQLPAKLMDAMMAGRAVVASDIAPLRWALAGNGLLVAPGDSRALAAALRELCDPVRRQELGSAAYAHAMETFGVRAVAPAFAAHVKAAIESGTNAARTS
jgi:glycosyltransferase involved in cell wall biosynthesis